MRVCDFLSDQHVDFEAVLHPPAYTASRRAKYLRVTGTQVAKTVLLAVGNQFVMAVLPATHRVDLNKVAKRLQAPTRLATDKEIADHFLDCEWGAMTPFAALYGLTTILDQSIDLDSTIMMTAQRHGMTIRLLCRDFERLEKPRRFAFARPVRGNGPTSEPTWPSLPDRDFLR